MSQKCYISTIGWGGSPRSADSTLKLYGGWCPRHNHVCQVSNWNLHGLRFYSGSNFRFSYWFLHALPVMDHLVFGINFQIHSVSLVLVLIHLLIHFSTRLSHNRRSRHPSLIHSFTPGSKPTFSTNPSHLRFILPPWYEPTHEVSVAGRTRLSNLMSI